ncbi:hypothetical protein [Streptomyces erythrochromogenes]|nr:hypothetical protein OG489_06095 [Streptomyces erythrochromogenes]
MTGREPRTAPRVLMRLTMMLVLALTVGLLGMHALGPAATPPCPA